MSNDAQPTAQEAAAQLFGARVAPPQPPPEPDPLPWPMQVAVYGQIVHPKPTEEK